jgi:hypothetical protein
MSESTPFIEQEDPEMAIIPATIKSTHFDRTGASLFIEVNARYREMVACFFSDPDATVAIARLSPEANDSGEENDLTQ